MTFIKKLVPSLMGLLLIAGATYAQGQQMQQMQNSVPDSVSDQELHQFVNTTQSLQSIQKDTRDKVETLVSNKGMKFDRFQKIMMSKQNPQTAKNVEVSDEEQKKIKEIQPKLMEINQEAQQQFVQAIKDEGLSPQRFQQIMQAVRSNPDVSKRFQDMVSGSSQG